MTEQQIIEGMIGAYQARNIEGLSRIAQLEAAIKKDSQLLTKVLLENAELITEVADMRAAISEGEKNGRCGDGNFWRWWAGKAQEIATKLTASRVRVKELEAENAALKKRLAGKWLPIESAPKDVCPILVCQGRNAIIRVARGCPINERWVVNSGPMRFIAEVTHWQPLPPPPKGE